MSKGKILIAEDDPNMLTLLTILLNLEDFDVVTLGGEDDVQQAVRREQPDVLLMDVHLLQQSGLDILEQIRRADDTRFTRVIMSSGSNLEQECLQRGADHFLPKPYRPIELTNILNSMLHPGG